LRRSCAHGFDGDISLLNKGAHEPYELPPLSKAFLQGEKEPSELALRDGHYAKHWITLRKDEKSSPSIEPLGEWCALMARASSTTN
jgi:hypothetical protein